VRIGSLQQKLSFIVEKHELLAISTVPRGADGDGVRQPGQRFWRPTAFRRLVLHTLRGDLVVETLFARRRADTLAALYGLERRPDR
jgi:hypothetical protein